MLEKLHPNFAITLREPPADEAEISSAVARYPTLPTDYLELVAEAGAMELEDSDGQLLRLWRPGEIAEMDQANEVSLSIPRSIPLGDNGGGKVIIHFDGKHGTGLYSVGYGSLAPEECQFLARNLTELLSQGLLPRTL